MGNRKHLSRFLLGAKNSAKCSWRSNPNERCATSDLAMLATHRTDYMRPPQLSHFLLEARKSANCCMPRRSYDHPAIQHVSPRDLPDMSRCVRERGAHIAPCPAGIVRRQSFRKPSSPIAQSPPHYVLVTVPAYRFAAGTVPSTAFAPSRTRELVSPTGTTAPFAAPFTTYLRSRVRQMPPRSCPGLMSPRRAQSTALAVMEYHHCKPR